MGPALRPTTVALLALALLLVGGAGCLGEPAEPTGSADPGAGDAPPGDGGGAAQGEARDADANGTAGDADGNGTAEPSPQRPHDPGWPPIDEAPIRPGAKLGVLDLRGWNYCTVGFVLSDPSNTTLYVASAAHCFGDVEIGTEVALAGIEGAGTLAYCSWGTAAHGNLSACPAGEALALNRTRDNDLALVRVADAHRGEVHPAMRGFGGPASLDREASLGEKVLTYGNSPYRDDGGQAPDALDPREGYVEGQDEWTTWFNLIGHTTDGDSGSPVRTPEGALGLLIRTGGPDNPVGVYATNLGRAIDYVREHTELSVELKTWPEQASGRLPGTP